MPELSTMARPPRMRHNFHRVAILFAGGPAPAANAVISTAATAFLRNDIEVVGVLHGYSHLVEYSPERPLVEGRDYVMLTHRMLGRTRNSQGILIGTARTNPGKNVSHPSHLDDPERVKPLKTVYEALRSIGVDALISIGGDDTLKTANKFKLYPGTAAGRRARGFPSSTCRRRSTTTTAASTSRSATSRPSISWAAKSATCSPTPRPTAAYFLVETMGRSAGWLAYGVAIAGEASLVISVEDIDRHVSRRRKTSPIRRPGENEHAQGDERRRGHQAHRADDDRPRARRQGVRRDRDGRRPGRAAAGEVPGRHRPRRARPHQHRAVNLARHVRRADRQGIHAADRQEAQDHRPAARLRSRAAPSRTRST